MYKPPATAGAIKVAAWMAEALTATARANIDKGTTAGNMAWVAGPS